MFPREGPEILANPEVLEEHYLPTEMPYREKEIDLLQSSLMPALKGRRPLHVWIYGYSGSGKTALVKYVLNKKEEEFKLRSCFIDCVNYSTQYAVLSRLIQELAILGNNQERSTALKIEIIRKGLGERPCIVVLDNMGKLRPKEREKILWTLCSFEKVGLVCISSSLQVVYSLEERLLDRLCPVVIELPSYPERAICSILKRRAELSLREGSWGRQVINKVTRLSGPNARLAIHTLRRAAELAEAESSQKITLDHIARAFTQIRSVRSNTILQRLSRHHRFIYAIVRGHPCLLYTSPSPRD